MILNYISRMMRCKQIRRVERKLSSSIHHTQQRVGQRLDEVYHILQDVSRTRTIRPRNRAALKRMQSFPAPELKDRNHNHKIQKLLTLVQTLREEEPPARPRRFSLPLPVSPTLQPANFGRGSLQVFTTNGPCRQRSEREIVRNGYQRKLQDKPATLVAPTDIEIRAEILDSPNIERDRSRCHTPMSKLTIIDVISAEPKSDFVADRRTVIDMEGLQCTRV
ncbi:hypothetical protein X975_22968, partial [Stegodyphus mimosarum]